ncbi:AMP-binding protein [Micromonospora terminaliae]|uniref:AMP-binding protein n=1 Tax=Micromonospora terminaliae TaxID=1914461 RepID=A0AAJ2ZHL6_9ACTN|nr:AMP-binding protein [Micromonospora terminaliae]NES30207.1 AMP-binding protein [Micromonospora terminaliae]QGL47022.1 AMP-binding protein [Micromonospora terminaliae]
MIIETGLWGGTVDPPCVLASFERSLNLRPWALAVADSEHQLTYQDLSVWIARITDLLHEAGVRAGDTVAVTGRRSAAIVAAAWAVIGAGATYLPLDTNFPHKRLAYMLAETGAKLLLHTGPDPELPAPRRAQIPAWSDVDRQTGPALAFVPCTPDAPVYVIYTSGSTGNPKGVALPHSCIDNMAHWQRHHSVHQDLRTAQFAPLNFDIWFQETLSTLGGGGSLVVMPEELRQDPIELLDWLARERIERLFLPCVALHMLATAATAFDSLAGLALREINTAGEQLVCTPAIKEFFQRLPECGLNNHYGQSESHTVSAHTLAGPSNAWPALAPIGLPLPGCEILLDTDEAGESHVGELLVAGAPLALGYLNQPELNAQRYVTIPPTAHGHTRAFRTGDLASVDNGVLHFLGRTDDEVKIRGYRVNPLEVEACLGRQPGVVEAICVPVNLGAGSRQLRGAVTVAAGTEFDAAAALAALREELPWYAIPPSISVLPSMPRTSSGKADRAAIARLLAPGDRSAVAADAGER